ncbi:MAG: hypothetical protein AB6733_21920 [Clostridiaceae bacterium]
MYLKHSIGFLIASIIQALIIMTTEFLGVSSLGVSFTFKQILTHIIVGQIIGYILLLITRSLKIIITGKFLTMGIIVGVISWVIILSINSILGIINAPWNQGVLAVLSSITAFIAYGVIAVYTIKRYDNRKKYL